MLMAGFKPDSSLNLRVAPFWERSHSPVRQQGPSHSGGGGGREGGPPFPQLQDFSSHPRKRGGMSGSVPILTLPALGKGRPPEAVQRRELCGLPWNWDLRSNCLQVQVQGAVQRQHQVRNRHRDPPRHPSLPCARVQVGSSTSGRAWGPVQCPPFPAGAVWVHTLLALCLASF